MFYLVPHPKLARPQRGSPRMFAVDWIEKYFSRVRPWHVVALWVPIAVAFLWHQTRIPGLSIPVAVACFAGGVVAWTLSEYLLHRHVFHFKPRSEWQQEVSFLIHGVHHDYPWDADRLVMPPAGSLAIGVGLWGVMWLVFRSYSSAAFAGMALGYVWYDVTHYYVHHGKPTSRYGKWLRSYHLVHHFSTPNRRFGITSPVWDMVFGTYPQDEHATTQELDGRQRAAHP